MIAFALILQATQPAPVTPPDIQLSVSATARRVVVEREGELDLRVYARTNGREGEGNLVEVRAPEVPEGRRQLNNVRVDVTAEARLPDPQNRSAPRQEPAAPQ